MKTMFDRNLVDLLTTSKPVEVASCLNDEQIRSILPSLLWLGLQQSPKTHRLPVSAELLRVVSRFHDVETIIELFRIDFPNLNLEIERLQRIKEKSLGDGQTTNNAIIHQEIVGFEQSSPRDRSRLIAQVLLDPLQNDVPLVLNLLDDPTRIQSIVDVLYVLILHLPQMFKFNILIGNLLHSKYAFDYLIRLIFNLPTLQKTFLDLIIRCSRNDAHRCEILRTIIRLHPHQKYPLLRLCHQRQTLLPLIVDFLDCSTINMLVEILSNHQSCLWLKKSLHDELIEKILRKLFQIHYQDNRLIQSILKSIGILHVQCKVQFNAEQNSELMKIISSNKEDTVLCLSFLFVVPSIVEGNEQILTEWLLPEIVSKEMNEELLMIGLFCVTNSNEALNTIVGSNLDFAFRLDSARFQHLKMVLVQRIFTNDFLVQRFGTMKISKNLNATRTSCHVAPHFISFLLSKGLCNQHQVEMGRWVWAQILECSTPIHPVMLTLISEFVGSIVDPRHVRHLKPIDEQIIRDYLLTNKENLAQKILILFYLLTLIDQTKNFDLNRFDKTVRPLFDLFPFPKLLEELTKTDYDGISPQLGRMMMEQLPQIFLADHTLYLTNDSTVEQRKIDSEDELMEKLLVQLKSALEHGISRRKSDRWKRQWFTVYAFKGQLLTLRTAQTLLNKPHLTYEDLCTDPHSLLRTSFQIYNFPPIVQILLLIMRELLIASRHRFERLTYHKTAQPNSSNEFFFTQDQKSKQLQETLAHSQEALIIQILLDILHKFKKTSCLPAYRELQGVVCAFIHQMFINNPDLAKIVHFQGYPSDQIKAMVYSVPSMHISLDFIPQMLASNILEIQIFAFELLTELCSFYPIRTALLVAKLSIQVYATLLRILPFDDRLRFFARTYRFLLEMSSVFPPLTSSSVYVVQQALRTCSVSPSNLPQLNWTSNFPGRAQQIDE